MARPSNSPARPEAGPPANGSRIKRLLEASADRLAAVLPKHLTPERVIQIVSTMTFTNPKLAECSEASILAAVIEASELGLDLTPKLGEAWLVPVWNKHTGRNECQLRPGYQGLKRLAMNSGNVLYIQTHLVREGDVFEVETTNTGQSIRHVPRFTGEVTHTFAMARLRGVFEPMIEVMTRDDIERIRARSQTPNAGPWVSDWGEMARKTVLKRLCKSLPRSTELVRAIAADDRDYEDSRAAQQAAPALPRASRTEALRRQLAGPEEESQEPEILAEEVSQEQGREPGGEG